MHARRLYWLLFFITVTCVGPILIVPPTLRAQDIMTFEEYQQLDHAEPYIYRIESGDAALLYFGSRHSFDPSDPQMDELEAAWTSFAPDVAYSEAAELSLESASQTEAIERAGEFGRTWMLARRDTVPLHELDPVRGLEIAYLREEGWSDEQLMLFFTLRQVSQSTQQQVSVSLEAAVPKYLTSLVERFDMKGPATLNAFEDAAARLLPDVADWRTIPESYFYPGPQNPSYFTNEISTDNNNFRDQHHVRTLIEAVRSGHRVFAISGSAHAVMQEPALRAALED